MNVTLPKIGTVATIEVPNSSPCRALFHEPATNVYSGTVVAVPWWMDDKSCKYIALTSTEPLWPVRIIAVPRIISVNGRKLKHVQVGKQIKVKGSKGAIYTVILNGDGTATCDCTSGRIRKSCRHMADELAKDRK